jgi:hypothetical protein
VLKDDHIFRMCGGGRHGYPNTDCTFAGAAARAHPHLSGIGFDLPPVGPVFEAFITAAGLEDRVRFAAGDFFADPLPLADVHAAMAELWPRPSADVLPRGRAAAASSAWRSVNLLFSMITKTFLLYKV